MADRVLCIEIGPKITKVVETEYHEADVIYHGFSFDTPDGVYDNGNVHANEAFMGRLTEGLKEQRIKTKKAVFAIQAGSIGTKEEKIPKMKENRIADYVKTNAAIFFPVNPDSYFIVYRLNGVEPDGKYLVQLYAIPKQVIESYERLAEKCGLTILDLEVMDNGIAQLLRKWERDELVVNVTVETTTSYITIVKKDQVKLQRIIPYGIGDAITSVQESGFLGEGKSFLETAEAMFSTRCFQRQVDEEDYDEDAQEVRRLATEEVRYVIGNIIRILDYYSSRKDGEAVDYIYLSGLGSMCQGFDELLVNELNHQIVKTEDTILSTVNNKHKVKNLGLYFTTLASCIQPVGVAIENKKKGFSGLKKLARPDEDLSVAKKFLVVCLLLVVVMAAVSLGGYYYLDNQKNSLQSQINSMQEAKNVNDEYQEAQSRYDYLTDTVLMTETANDAFLVLLQEMEAGLPSTVVVNAISADAGSVVVDMEAPSQEVVADAIQAFRGFQSVDNIDVNGVVATSSEDASTHYTFSVTCYYVTDESIAALAQETADAQSSIDAAAAAQNDTEELDEAEEEVQEE
jgi:type IV pilus assembly protein PilM